MEKQSFNFELTDIIRQFLSAIDGCVINRYHDKTRNISDKIAVKYVYAPKQKVVEDLVNPAANVQLPVVAVTINTISRDPSRVFNKIYGMTIPQGVSDTDTKSHSDNLPMPVPVNINLTLSILTKYQRDMDQILQNFIVYCNPYFIISWKVPTTHVTQPHEIRSKVKWNETITVKTPIDIAATTTSHIEADTSFDIEGWLFTGVAQPIGNILYIIENLIPVDDIVTCEANVATREGVEASASLGNS